MPLFQPTNIIPSTLSGLNSGVIDASNEIVISWQVNGNEPMTGYNIDFYQNNTASTLVASIQADGLQFYPNDARGNPQIFTVQLADTWASKGFGNGQEYKLKITQYWGNATVGSETTNKVTQYSESVFITRAKPVVLFSFPPTITTPSNTFTASYSQAQSDAINWCRWRLALVNGENSYNIVEDTGEIPTSLLQYTYDGFVNNANYAIRLDLETESGDLYDSNWVSFNVIYTENETDEVLTTLCMDDSSVLIKAPAAQKNYVEISGDYAFEDNSLEVQQGQTASWSGLSFSPPYTAIWQGDVTGFNRTFYQSGFTVNAISKVNLERQQSVYIVAAVSDSSSSSILLYEIVSDSTIQYVSSLPLSDSPIGDATISTSYGGDYGVVTWGSGVKTFNISASGVLSNLQSLYVSSEELPVNGEVINCAQVTNYFGKIIVGTSNRTLQFYFSSGTALYELELQINGQSISSTCMVSVEEDTGYIVVGLRGATAMAALFSPENGEFVFSSYIMQKQGSPAQYQCRNIIFTVSNEIIVHGNFTYGSTYEEIFDNLSVYIEAYTLGSTPTLKNNLSNVQNLNAGRNWSFDSEKNLLSNGEGIFYYNPVDSSVEYLYALDATGYNAQFVFVDVGEELDLHSLFIGGSNGLYCFDVNESITAPSNSVKIGGNEIYYSVPYLLITGLPSITKKGAVAEVLFAPSTIRVTFYDKNTVSYQQTFNISTAQTEITAISIVGYMKTQYFWILKGTYLPSVPYVPQFTSSTYCLSNFSENDSSLYIKQFVDEASFLYRSGQGEMKNITPRDLFNNIRDYGIRSGISYTYQLTQGYGNDFSIVRSSSPIKIQLKGYYLIEATEDEENPNVYHAVNVWKFGNNIEAGSVSNNNSPNWLTNFTPYRYRQPNSRCGKSGTLQALLSNVVNGEYKDSFTMQESLYNASLSTNVFFLKDMKGNIYMVHISAPIVQTINTKSVVQQVSVSIPWEEVGDATNVSIIQTTLDAGWKRDMVGEVSLYVDAETGYLYATYPDNYVGTTFRLSNQNLYAQTPSAFDEPNIYLSQGQVILEEGGAS